MQSATGKFKSLWNEDRDAKRVAVVMVAALACGAFLVALAASTWPNAFAGLLWAGACSSVGWFLGFLFGIPRSLSTDTARTTAPAGSEDATAASNAASSKAEASRASAVKAAKDKSDADQNVAARATEAQSTAADAADAARTAEQQPTDPVLASKAAAAKAAADWALSAKNAADAAASATGDAAKAAADQAEVDQAAALATKSTVAEPTRKLVAPQGPSTAVNTNLEQISDWLTKIIVGVTLVESKEVLDHLSNAAHMIAGSLGGEKSVSFAFAILIYFSFAGLLGSYLLTRLFLQRAFMTAANSTDGSE